MNHCHFQVALNIRIGQKVLSFSQHQLYNHSKADEAPPLWPTLAPPNSNKHQTACSCDRESDAPLEVIHWPAQGELTPIKLLQLTNHPPDAPVKVVSVDEEEREMVQRFQNKVSVLKQNNSAVAGFQGGQHQYRCLHCRSDPQWWLDGVINETGRDLIRANIIKKPIKSFLPKQKAPLFLGALFVNQKLKLSRW